MLIFVMETLLQQVNCLHFAPIVLLPPLNLTQIKNPLDKSSCKLHDRQRDAVVDFDLHSLVDV